MENNDTNIRQSSEVGTMITINRPQASYHMTSAEWKKMSADYKGFSVIFETGERVRTALRLTDQGSCLLEVFLTDRGTTSSGGE